MDYINTNKEAWEEAYEHRKDGWDESVIEKLSTEDFPFIEEDLIVELNLMDLKEKTIGQFCCNNGREILSIMKFGAKEAIGFDIAENMIEFANKTANELDVNAKFLATNILEIPENYNNTFDYIFITIGAITWFKDLDLFFNKVSSCLKDGGVVILNEMHPFTNMLAVKGEGNFDSENISKLVNSYFSNKPWIGNDGMGYMTEKSYKSKTFTSYAHSMASIISSMGRNRIYTTKLVELEKDISSIFADISNKGLPLSYILIGKK